MFSLTFIKTYLKKTKEVGGILVIALMLTNLINFVFNAYLGRSLSAEEFGTVTLINTLYYVLAILINSLGGSVNFRSSFLSTNINKEASFIFFRDLYKRLILFGILLTLVWIIAIPWVSNFFQISNDQVLLFFTPIIIFSLLASISRGYLQANTFFSILGILLILEALSKLIFAFIFVHFNLKDYAYLAIPGSIIISFLLVSITLIGKLPTVIKEQSYAFPKRYFCASLLTGISTSTFLSLDLILVKHFLSPVEAGQYSLLSLVGKIIFFLGTLFNGLIVTHISREMGLNKNPSKKFYKLLTSAILLIVGAYIFIGIFGFITVPILFGAKANPILPYLNLYCLAISFFTVSNIFITYHLAKSHFSLAIVTLISSLLMILGIIFNHQDINQVTQVILYVSIFNLAFTLFMHILQKNGKFIFRNILDLFDVFSSVPKTSGFTPLQKKILIFNWRDINHSHAGGAEIYLHELAKRWVKKGHFVTLFCGNDRENPSDEIIDGVNIVRRGGFYFVYVWAFIYYILKFRNKYDLIIDCQNGVPFFTPLYCKEKIYGLMFHVHQEVFSNSLPGPLAFVALITENRFMPWVYKKVKFITISKSSKEEMKKLEVGLEGIEIIYPGVDINLFKPASKNNTPLILHIGRLKKYKSVDVFIKAAKKVLKDHPKSEFIIGGDGDEKDNLELLSKELNLQDKIKFLGKISEEEKISLYQRAWVFVNPSSMEGWGITNIEANACGTPVVASNVPGIKNSVNHNKSGFLVEYGKHEDFAERISHLIRDDRLRKRMSKQAIIWSHKFDWQKSAQKGLNILI